MFRTLFVSLVSFALVTNACSIGGELMHRTLLTASLFSSFAVLRVKASGIRGGATEDYEHLIRRLQSGKCDPPGSPIWDNLAVRNGLDPAIWAEKLYQTCVNDSNNENKAETISKKCWSSSVIAPWVGIMQWSNDPNMRCNSNEQCLGLGGKCFYRYRKSDCIPDSSGMLPECGTLVANPNLPNDDPTSTAAAPSTTEEPPSTTTEALPIPTTTQEPPTTAQATTTEAPPIPTTVAATTSTQEQAPATTEDPCGDQRRLVVKSCEPLDMDDPTNIWTIIAEKNNLDPTEFAPKLYKACVDSLTQDDDDDDDFKEGTIRTYCFDSTSVMMYKIFTSLEDKECEENAHCGLSTGVCFYRKGKSSCTRDPLMKAECGTTPVKPIAVDNPVTSPTPVDDPTPAPVDPTPPPNDPETTVDPCVRRLETTFACDPAHFERLTKASGLDPVKYTSGLYQACVDERGALYDEQH